MDIETPNNGNSVAAICKRYEGTSGDSVPAVDCHPNPYVTCVAESPPPYEQKSGPFGTCYPNGVTAPADFTFYVCANDPPKALCTFAEGVEEGQHSASAECPRDRRGRVRMAGSRIFSVAFLLIVFKVCLNAHI